MTPTIPPITRNYIEIAHIQTYKPHELKFWRRRRKCHDYLATFLNGYNGKHISLYETAARVDDSFCGGFVYQNRLEFTAKIAKSGPRLFKVGDVVTVVRDVKEWLALGGPLGQGTVWEVMKVENVVGRMDHPQLLTLGIYGHTFGTASGWWFCEEGEEG